MRIHPRLSQRFKVREDALHPANALLRPLHMNRVGAEINPHAERVFHQSQVFVAGPKQGLKVGRNLQSDLQWNKRPPWLSAQQSACDCEMNIGCCGDRLEE